MTTTPALVAEEIGRRRERNVSIWIGASLTSFFVVVGALVATFAIPPMQTPTDVAETYLEARYAGNMSVAWDLECAATRFFVGGYTGFVESSAHWDGYLSLPAHVEVAVGAVHEAVEPGKFASISAVVTSSESSDWRIAGALSLVVEDGRLRVCDGGLGLR